MRYERACAKTICTRYAFPENVGAAAGRNKVLIKKIIMNNMSASLTNLDFLVNFTGNDHARMRKYITMFLGSAPGEAENIRKAMAGQNRDAMRASAHALRPQMTYMGMKNGEMQLREIEEKAVNGTDFNELSGLVKQFGDDFDAACEELREKLKQIE
jgi:HPt (histidine-containing phosphotransfer) domain-containing protein